MFCRKLAIRILFPLMLMLPACSLPAQTRQQQEQSAESIQAAESLQNSGKWTRAIQSALIAERYEELDAAADRYRSGKMRFPGGFWRLSGFYAALNAPQQSDKDSAEHLAHIEQWMQERPKSITARVAMAASLNRWAWVARGNGYAKTVTQEGWQQFRERMAKAQAVLEAAASLGVTCPQWYSEMMSAGLAQGWSQERMKGLFEEAVRNEPDYHAYYLQYANYLQPKWHGKPGEAAAFATSSADNLGGVEGDALYYEIAASLIKRGNDEFSASEMDWQRIQGGYWALVAKYGVTVQRKNEIAYMAWKFKDSAVARQQFDLIGDGWSQYVWGDRQLFDRVRDWAHGSTT